MDGITGKKSYFRVNIFSTKCWFWENIPNLQWARPVCFYCWYNVMWNKFSDLHQICDGELVNNKSNQICKGKTNIIFYGENVLVRLNLWSRVLFFQHYLEWNCNLLMMCKIYRAWLAKFPIWQHPTHYLLAKINIAAKAFSLLVF